MAVIFVETPLLSQPQPMAISKVLIFYEITLNVIPEPTTSTDIPLSIELATTAKSKLLTGCLKTLN